MRAERPSILLLAGTVEAREIAAGLARCETVPAFAALAGATRDPRPLPLPTRVGGFGSAEGFAACLHAHGIGAVVDATHPFAWRMSARSAAVCARLEVPYLQVLRPPWRPGPRDRWIPIAREDEAAGHIPARATVFLATGRQTLERFGGLSGCRVICRQIDPPEAPFPFPDGEYLIGRPPFSVADEVALFRRLGVDWLVVKNAGGSASRTKLDAAAELGLPVLMIERPPQPDAQRVESAAEALDWIAGLS